MSVKKSKTPPFLEKNASRNSDDISMVRDLSKKQYTLGYFWKNSGLPLIK